MRPDRAQGRNNDVCDRPGFRVHNLPDVVRSDILERLTKCAAPQHYLRVTSMGDESSNSVEGAKANIVQRQSDERLCTEADFQYGPELLDIGGVEFGFVSSPVCIFHSGANYTSLVLDKMYDVLLCRSEMPPTYCNTLKRTAMNFPDLRASSPT
jgi:hypothetical protein